MSTPIPDQLVAFLYTEDLEATDRFYRETLGLTLALDQGPCRIYRVTDTAFIGFCRAGTAVGRAAPAADGVILTLVSDQVDDWYNQLVERGIPVEQPPKKNDKFNLYHCFIRDPNGFLIEIQTFLDPTWPRPAGAGSRGSR